MQPLLKRKRKEEDRAVQFVGHRNEDGEEKWKVRWEGLISTRILSLRLLCLQVMAKRMTRGSQRPVFFSLLGLVS